MKILFGLHTPDSGVIEVDGAGVEEFVVPRTPSTSASGWCTSTSCHPLAHRRREPHPRDRAPARRILRPGRSRPSRRALQALRPAGRTTRPREQSQSVKGSAWRYQDPGTGARILILDEPTAVLTPQETDELFRVLRNLVQQGMSVVLITHKLREVLASDRVTVMRGGKRIGTVETAESSADELARMMVGRDVLFRVDKEEATPGETLLEVHKLGALDDRGLPALRGATFKVGRGEIYGVAGVEGNGQSELIEVVTGLRRATSGWVDLAGARIERYSVRRRRELGLAHIPEDRLTYGASATASVAENAAMGYHYRRPLAAWLWLSRGKLLAWA
ncbi:MAG: ATP-binding cassette domain-containing protein, partial [Chloroflexia bacterium]